MLSVGIVGLPNVGKSTVFNAISCGGAKVSDYAFCTIEPNRAVVSVPDSRLERVAQIYNQQRVVPAAIEFVDIAGLVRGASHGEGLGNQFLAAIREVDAILHVVRCFDDPRIPHVEGKLDPFRDVQIVELELILADLATIQRRREKIASQLKARNKDAEREAAAVERLTAQLNSGQPARAIADRADLEETAQLHLLTAKPVIFLANVGENEDMDQCEKLTGRIVTLTAKLEADLASLPDEERAAFAAEMQVDLSGLERVIRACYEVLDLITFYTGVGAEASAWAIPRGTPLGSAAGKIHSDMERGFIRAEVIGFDSLDSAGSWQQAHHHGLVRTEGRDYTVQDGDVAVVRFHG